MTHENDVARVGGIALVKIIIIREDTVMMSIVEGKNSMAIEALVLTCMTMTQMLQEEEKIAIQDGGTRALHIHRSLPMGIAI